MAGQGPELPQLGVSLLLFHQNAVVLVLLFNELGCSLVVADVTSVLLFLFDKALDFGELARLEVFTGFFVVAELFYEVEVVLGFRVKVWRV